MTRRRFTRYTIEAAPPATLRVLRDASVQRVTDREVVVLSTVPGVLSEAIAIDIPGAGGHGRCRLAVRIAESRPVVVNGTVRYRLRMTVLRRSRAAAGSGRQEAKR